MTLTRKALLARTGAAVAAGTIAGCGHKDEPKPAPVDLRDWDDVRGLYPLKPGLHHLNAFLLAPHTRPVAGPHFLVAGTHKWLAGPRGTAILWGRAWEHAAATIPAFNAGGGGPGPAHTPGDYHSFEHRWALADAFKLHAKIGPDRILASVTPYATPYVRFGTGLFSSKADVDAAIDALRG